jgi:DUF1680 family protein
VEASESQKPRSLLVFMPSWIRPESVAVAINGKPADAKIDNSFLQVRRPMAKGDVIEVQFTQAFRCADPLYPKRMPGYHRYLYGPMVLGMDAKDEAFVPKATTFEADEGGCYRAYPGGATPIVTLAPLCDLMDVKDEARRTKTGSAQILFRD